ncbi:MAG: 16S rRNA (cytidine(1402)-2'-O)-methyltransferase [Alphaproteobacteria bacterium]
MKPTADDGTPLAPGLYLVATPIGNLGDMTLRALSVLRRADVIACEDSRVTRKLLSAYGIATPLTPYHDHNAARARPALLRRLRDGAAVALVSDAGTPLVSDPGYKLAAAARDAEIAVTAVPGASAAIAALTLSGLPCDTFFFAGFAPPRSAARKRALAALAAVPGSLVFYESAQRVADFLADAAEVLGDRAAAVCRELTKLHEEIARDSLHALAARYRADGPPRGEVVVVIAPPGDDSAADMAQRLDDALGDALARHTLRDAVDAVAAATGLPRRRVYARALELNGGAKGR